MPKSGELGITPILVHPVVSDSVTHDEWRFIIRLCEDENGKWNAQRYFDILSVINFNSLTLPHILKRLIKSGQDLQVDNTVKIDVKELKSDEKRMILSFGGRKGTKNSNVLLNIIRPKKVMKQSYVRTIST